MELIINEKEFSVWDKLDELPKEIVGYNFYSISGSFIGRFPLDNNTYPKASYRILVNLNGNEVEIPSGQNLYKIDNNKYFIGREY